MQHVGQAPGLSSRREVLAEEREQAGGEVRDALSWDRGPRNDRGREKRRKKEQWLMIGSGIEIASHRPSSSSASAMAAHLLTTITWSVPLPTRPIGENEQGELYLEKAFNVDAWGMWFVWRTLAK